MLIQNNSFMIVILKRQRRKKATRSFPISLFGRSFFVLLVLIWIQNGVKNCYYRPLIQRAIERQRVNCGESPITPNRFKISTTNEIFIEEKKFSSETQRRGERAIYNIYIYIIYKQWSFFKQYQQTWVFEKQHTKQLNIWIFLRHVSYSSFSILR